MFSVILPLITFIFASSVHATTPKKVSSNTVYLRPGNIVFIQPTRAQLNHWMAVGNADDRETIRDMRYYVNEATKYLDAQGIASTKETSNKKFIYVNGDQEEVVDFLPADAGGIAILCSSKGYKVVSTVDFVQSYTRIMDIQPSQQHSSLE
ncbi:hypothetical protein [Prevotella sp. S7 MS 2]|uniref:hypothetical protein n=1 Tax=Prevotella sp. S7 MS 2 TaxID=1287488 RepID=UPI0018DE2168|nr:hypothetical protein [Prevotella sp. S7 MS 2]